jgi:hypothetical protein
VSPVSPLMRQSQTAVLERNTTLTGEFATEPYEAAWAGEARWFVQVLDRSADDAELVVTTQVSPDGLTWCDHDGGARRTDGELTTWAVREFGQWLRVRGAVTPAGAQVKVRIYLAVKS